MSCRFDAQQTTGDDDVGFVTVLLAPHNEFEFSVQSHLLINGFPDCRPGRETEGGVNSAPASKHCDVQTPLTRVFGIPGFGCITALTIGMIFLFNPAGPDIGLSIASSLIIATVAASALI